MSISSIIIDPMGDTLITLPHLTELSIECDSLTAPSEKRDDCAVNAYPEPSSIKENPSSAEKTTEIRSETHFRVSKKHLTIASPRAQAMFAGGFKESIPQDDGFCHWNFEPIFDPEAFEIVMKIIHGKTRMLPQKVTFEMLASISTIVDDLQCHDATWFIVKQWLSHIPQRIPKEICEGLARWILISFVFEDAVSFRLSTQQAILHSDGPMPNFGLPIHPQIIDTIDSIRQDTLEKLVEHSHALMNALCRKEIGCNFGCRSMLLGALIQEMNSGQLYSPRPVKPFPGLGVSPTIKGLRQFESPDYFCAEEVRSNMTPRETWRFTENSYALSTFKSRKPGAIQGIENKASKIPERLVYHTCSLGDLLHPQIDELHRGVKGLEVSSFTSLCVRTNSGR
ncbi:hypothetical protein BKA56DRAFT_575457 [Ilyonectria sp. MPI-CAGE-AT-0026]|nr:hypothetical protein BKA56DRAFT_575457 [Ilyonectria sp. MPI-CAGE-AT-0026]